MCASWPSTPTFALQRQGALQQREPNESLRGLGCQRPAALRPLPRVRRHPDAATAACCWRPRMRPFEAVGGCHMQHSKAKSGREARCRRRALGVSGVRRRSLARAEKRASAQQHQQGVRKRFGRRQRPPRQRAHPRPTDRRHPRMAATSEHVLKQPKTATRASDTSRAAGIMLWKRGAGFLVCDH